MIEEIKINVAFEPIFIYDNEEIVSIKSDIPIYLIYNLNHYGSKKENVALLKKLIAANDSDAIKRIMYSFFTQTLNTSLDNYYNTINLIPLDDLYKSNDNFIYPIYLGSNNLFKELASLDLDRRLIDCIHNKRAKICFFQLFEGFFGLQDDEFLWLYNLSIRYGFEKNDIIIVTANMIAKERHEKIISTYNLEDNFTVFPYSYFQHNLWWLKDLGKLLDPNLRKSVENEFNIYLKNNQINKKKFHFLCFNRIPRGNRLAIFGELSYNENLKGKSILSLGWEPTRNKTLFVKLIKDFVRTDYKYDIQKLIDFYTRYDNSKHYTYDCPDLEHNKANVLNQYAHENAFVNIVTETLINPKSVFFSEKTFKPIYACQPFIILGNPESLKKLKELGFKTFDKWWDESYDEEYLFINKVKKIKDILIEISLKTDDELSKMLIDMENVLSHNYDVFINYRDQLLFNALSESSDMNKSKNIKKLI